MVELHQLKARVLVLSFGFPAMHGCLVFLSLKRWLFYSVYSIFIWTTNWCANLSQIFYTVLENETLEPWKNVMWWLSHDTSSLKYASLKKNASADYNKFLSEFHQERKWSYSALVHSQPVPAVLKIYSGSSLVGCAHGDAETILPQEMWSSQRLGRAPRAWSSPGWEKGGRYQLGGDIVGSYSCISVLSYLPLFGLACYCLVFVLKMSQNLWSLWGGCPATCDSWHPAEIVCWLIMPSLRGTAELPSRETEQVLTNPSNIILLKTCVVMCSLSEHGSAPYKASRVFGCALRPHRAHPSTHTDQQEIRGHFYLKNRWIFKMQTLKLKFLSVKSVTMSSTPFCGTVPEILPGRGNLMSHLSSKENWFNVALCLAIYLIRFTSLEHIE